MSQPTANPEEHDVLSELLRLLGLQGEVRTPTRLAPRARRRVGGRGYLALIVPLAGEVELAAERSASAVTLRAGEVALIRRPPEADRPPDVEVRDRGEGCRLLEGWFTFRTLIRHPLLDGFPTRIHLSAEEGTLTPPVRRLVRALGQEASQPRPGGLLVREELMRVLFVAILRALAMDEQGRGFPGPLRDREVYRAIQRLHAEPARDWTVADLGREVALSRSALAERFRARTGTTPIRYLTRWRMALARDLLTDTDLPLVRVAERVGYGSDVAFSRAFRREMGRPPGEVRRRARG